MTIQTLERGVVPQFLQKSCRFLKHLSFASDKIQRARALLGGAGTNYVSLLALGSPFCCLKLLTHFNQASPPLVCSTAQPLLASVRFENANEYPKKICVTSQFLAG